MSAVSLAQARARARMHMSGTPTPLRRELFRLAFTNPAKRRILISMKSTEIAAHIRLLTEPGYDAKKLLTRLAKAGYEVFLPGEPGFEREPRRKTPASNKATGFQEARRAELDRAVRRSRLTEDYLLKEHA